MKKKKHALGGTLLAAGAAMLAGVAYGDDGGSDSISLRNGGYIAPMGSVSLSLGNAQLGTGIGGTLAAGIRRNFYAIEGRGFYSSVSASGNPSARLYGGAIDGLIFPFLLSASPRPDWDSWSARLINNSYLIGGGGGQDLRNYPGVGNTSIGNIIFQGGAGDLIGFRWGRYEFALRVEALYQWGYRQENSKIVAVGSADTEAPKHLSDLIFNVGLQLPLGLPPRAAAEAPPPPPPEVVPVEAVPPPSPPPPPPPPCVTPEAGQPINLQGCKAGDKIILHGVNFDFNKATLTVNAKAILDQVAGELKKYTAIDVELGGYTDGRGSVAYNLRLSDRRAASVKAYLVGAGVDAARMTSVGYGKADPVADNNTDEGRELNRRVELKITGGVASSSTTSTDAGTTTTAVTPPDAPAAADPGGPSGLSTAVPAEPGR